MGITLHYKRKLLFHVSFHVMEIEEVGYVIEDVPESLFALF